MWTSLPVDWRWLKSRMAVYFPTFVGESYPWVDAVGCVSRAQHNGIQQHQCQICSPRALSHPHCETLHSTFTQKSWATWAAKSVKQMVAASPASCCQIKKKKSPLPINCPFFLTDNHHSVHNYIYLLSFYTAFSRWQSSDRCIHPPPRWTA